MTNYEKIKTMTEDELTSFLAEPRCRHCDHGGEWEHCDPARHEAGIRRWLEMEATVMSGLKRLVTENC